MDWPEHDESAFRDSENETTKAAEGERNNKRGETEGESTNANAVAAEECLLAPHGQLPHRG